LNTSCLVKFIYKKGLGVEIGDQYSVVLIIVLWGFRCQGFEWVFGSTMLKFLTFSWNQSTTRFRGLLFFFFLYSLLIYKVI
jgi:hypothetical protein